MGHVERLRGKVTPRLKATAAVATALAAVPGVLYGLFQGLAPFAVLGALSFVGGVAIPPAFARADRCPEDSAGHLRVVLYTALFVPVVMIPVSILAGGVSYLAAVSAGEATLGGGEPLGPGGLLLLAGLAVVAALATFPVFYGGMFLASVFPLAAGYGGGVAALLVTGRLSVADIR